jgi:hypothetical protein
MPGELLWMRTFGPGEFDVNVYEDGLMEGYYNPCTCEYIPFADTICWKYDFYIDPYEAFIQEECNIYWLDVQAQPMDPEARFGWKTSVDHWNDDAVYAVGIEGDHDPWFELIYPPTHPLEGQSIDLAFELMTTTCGDTTPPIITKTHPEEGYLYDADAERGVDVLFVFDLSGSMDSQMGAVKTSAVDIMDDIRAQIPDSAFGVVTFVDYNGYYSCCGYNAWYGGSSCTWDYPYALNASITQDTAAIDSLISGLNCGIGDDLPQDYSRVLYESLHDLNIDWRTCRERVVVVFGDAPVHDCDFYLSGSTGCDPGRDATVGTSDDLDFETVVAELAAYGMTVMSVDCPGDLGGDAQLSFEYMAAQTGGEYYPLSDATNAADDIMDLAKGKAYIKPYATITLDAEDPLVPPCTSGVEAIFWRYEYEGVSYPEEGEAGAINGTDIEALYGYTDPMITDYWWYVEYDDHVEIYFEEDCVHTIYYWAKDNCCNPTPIHRQK